jgi:hypothetical protein
MGWMPVPPARKAVGNRSDPFIEGPVCRAQVEIIGPDGEYELHRNRGRGTGNLHQPVDEGLALLDRRLGKQLFELIDDQQGFRFLYRQVALKRIDPFVCLAGIDPPPESRALLAVEPEPFCGLGDPYPQVLDGIAAGPHHHNLPHALVRYPIVLQSAAPNARDETSHHQGRLPRTAVGHDRNQAIHLQGLDQRLYFGLPAKNRSASVSVIARRPTNGESVNLTGRRWPSPSGATALEPPSTARNSLPSSCSSSSGVCAPWNWRAKGGKVE